MSSDQRQPGFYRVKRLGRWEFAFYDGDVWLSALTALALGDARFEVIDETLIDPIPTAFKEGEDAE